MQLGWWHSYGGMQWVFLRIGLSKRCDITQQRCAQLFTKPPLIHLPIPWCPPFISQDDSVKLSVITLGSDRVAGASATTHHPIPLLASTSVSCGPPCACYEKYRYQNASFVYLSACACKIAHCFSVNFRINSHACSSTTESMTPHKIWNKQQPSCCFRRLDIASVW